MFGTLLRIKYQQILPCMVGLETNETGALLAEYDDTVQSAVWAKESMALCVKADILLDKGNKTLAPKDEITRAEVAVIVRRLLIKSELI